MSTLLLCPVPGGVDADGSAVLRVVVVPRLDAGPPADNFLAAWPPPTLRTSLSVTLTPTTGNPVTVEVTPRWRDQPGLWPLVFGRATVPPAVATARAAAAGGVTVTPTSLTVAALDASFRAATQAFAATAGPDPTGAQDAYATVVARELQSPAWAPPVISLGPPSELAQPRVDTPPSVTDANRIYGLLREHPRVLEALGLIFELELPSGTVPPGDGTVRVDWPGAGDTTPVLPTVVPRSTAYVDAVFLPAAADPAEIDHGVVPLDDPTRWRLAAVDSESAASRMEAPSRSGSEPVLDVLPALRTAGLLLLRVDRQQVFDTRRARSLALAAAEDPVLHAEDLVLGYRIDVRAADETTWNPLCARQATYHLDDTLVGTAAAFEEGHVKVHAAVRDASGQVRTDEVVTRWDGWSLAVPRPFPLRSTGLPGAGDDLSDPPDPADLPYRLSTEFAVPAASLPPLRFGTSYQLRARVADIAGGGVPVDVASPTDHATTAFTFARYEPVASPGITAVDSDADGSGFPLGQLVVTSEGGDPSGGAADPPSTGRTQRTLTRPTVALTTAEWHGALSGDAETTWPLVQLAAAQQLPDPAAYGLTATAVSDTVTVGPATRPWSAWPDTTATTIVVRPADADSPLLAWTDDGLVVSLAPAQEATVALASTVDRAVLEQLAVAGWSDPSSIAHGTDAGLTAATVGRHPMVTPTMTVSCVHAVRRPLLPASGAIVLGARDGASVSITPTRPVFGVDTASTGQVDVTASWTEVADGPTVPDAAMPSRQPVGGVPVQSLVVHRGDTTAEVVHHLPDTRYRQVTYDVTAVSRFRGFFPDGPDEDFAAAPLTLTVDVPSSERPAPPKVAAVVPAFAWDTTSTGSTITRVRRGNRVRVELERPWFDSGDDERIALVFARPATGDTTVDVTEVGRDPVQATVTPPRFPSAADVVASSDPVATVVRSVDGRQVDVVPAEVFADPAAGRWFADFALPTAAGGSYRPLMRPALARYQRRSEPGCELSAVVLADFVPLLPDRTLTVAVVGTRIAVTLTGITPQSEGAWGNVVMVAFEPTTDGTTPAPVHRTGPGLFPVVPDVRYGAVGDTIVYTVPAGHTVGRVRVFEVEDEVVPDPGHDPPDPPPMGTQIESATGAVFFDVVALPTPVSG
ncbi:hypothetical protein ACXR2U_13035 [Jatrophihabitans sp. YIM 134969]